MTDERRAVSELRVAITVPDFDASVRFLRDVLGIAERRIDWKNKGRLALLDVAHATIEIIDETQAAYIDEMEVGRRVSGPIRLALHVADNTARSAGRPPPFVVALYVSPAPRRSACAPLLCPAPPRRPPLPVIFTISAASGLAPCNLVPLTPAAVLFVAWTWFALRAEPLMARSSV